MNTAVQHDPRYPSSVSAQRINDAMLVSSFAIWAMLIGFAPVMAYSLLVA